MINEQRVRELLAAEKQQFEDFKAATQSALSAKDTRIAELEEQLANAQPGLPDEFEGIITDVVNP